MAHHRKYEVQREDGGRNNVYNPRQSVSPHRSERSGRTLDIVVYFKDKNAVQFSVRGGESCEAGELFEMVMEEMRFPPIARELFSLWLVSDLLEVQLRPGQVPFHLACFWVELLSKYTTTDLQEAQTDEPVIVFQRNVFYPLEKEKELVTQPILLHLLYHEARHNVLDDRYVMTSLDEYDTLAGLQAIIMYRGYNERTHTPHFYRSKLGDFYPGHVRDKDSKWSLLRGKDSPEHRVVAWHRQLSSVYDNLNLNLDEDRKQCYLAYLSKCWALSFYGAVYFRGQIERPAETFRLSSSEDLPVFIACNLNGVYIMDMDKAEFLINLSYKEFFWDYAEPGVSAENGAGVSGGERSVGGEGLACIFLYIKVIIEGSVTPKVLQIFSRESIMIDAMLRGCLEINKIRPVKPSDMLPIHYSRRWQDIERLVLKAASDERQENQAVF